MDVVCSSTCKKILMYKAILTPLRKGLEAVRLNIYTFELNSIL